MNRKNSSVLAAVVVLFPCLQLGCKTTTPEMPKFSAGEEKRLPSDVRLEDAVYQILKRANQPGSMVSRVECKVGQGAVQELYTVPRFSSNVTPEDALAQISATNQSITWAKSGGLFRVTDKDINPVLLRVRLKEFHVEQVSEPYQILNQLWEAPEVQEEKKKSGIGRLEQVSFLSGLKPNKTIAVNLQDVTVSDVLDTVASKFNGMWVYTECRSPDKVLVGFSFLRYE